MEMCWTEESAARPTFDIIVKALDCCHEMWDLNQVIDKEKKTKVYDNAKASFVIEPLTNVKKEKQFTMQAVGELEGS